VVLQFFYIVVIALTNNLDNFGARIAYSLQGIRINTAVNLWISVITFVITDWAASSGTLLSGFLGKQGTAVISMLLLSTIGLWMILEQYVRGGEGDNGRPEQGKHSGILRTFLKPANADRDNSRHIDFKEATILGIALSINNIGGGTSAGMMGLRPLWIGLFSAALSFVALWAGNYFAEYFIKRNLSKKTAFVAGFLLIAIGIKQIL